MMDKRKVLITALSLVLCLTVSIGIAVAYFTDYEDAKGGAVLKVSGRSEIEEEFDGNDKIVTISNTGDVDMVVRIKAFGDEDHMTVNVDKNSDWVKGSGKDSFWYYTKVIKAHEKSTPIKIEVKGPVTAEDPIDFEVTVVHESQRVAYDGNKVAVPAGWTIGSISAE